MAGLKRLKRLLLLTGGLCAVGSRQLDVVEIELSTNREISMTGSLDKSILSNLLLRRSQNKRLSVCNLWRSRHRLNIDRLRRHLLHRCIRYRILLKRRKVRFGLATRSLSETNICATSLMDLPVRFLTLRSAVAGVPTAVEARLFRTVRAPRRLFCFFPSHVDRSLLFDFTLMSNLTD